MTLLDLEMDYNEPNCRDKLYMYSLQVNDLILYIYIYTRDIILSLLLSDLGIITWVIVEALLLVEKINCIPIYMYVYMCNNCLSGLVG